MLSLWRWCHAKDSLAYQSQAALLQFADNTMGSRCPFFDMVEGHLFIWEQVCTCVYVCVCMCAWVWGQMSLLAYKCAISMRFKVGNDNSQRRKAHAERSQSRSLIVTQPSNFYECSEWRLNVKSGFLGKSSPKITYYWRELTSLGLPIFKLHNLPSKDSTPRFFLRVLVYINTLYLNSCGL